VNAVIQRSESYAFPVTGQQVRVLGIDGEPWWVASDVCDILGLSNMHSSLALLDEDEKGVHSMDTPGGAQQVTVVSEPGLYSLILRSRKPAAKAFKRWVTHEVLPAIRKTGSYSAPSPEPQPYVADLTKPEGVLALASLYQDAARQLVAATQRVAELEPAAEAWDVLASAEGDYSLRDAAHMLNRDPLIVIGQNRLMAFLRTEGLVDRKGIPYARYGRYLVERPGSYPHPKTRAPVATKQIRITLDGLAYLRTRLGGQGGSVPAGQLVLVPGTAS
jgi:anti-repressor protein